MSNITEKREHPRVAALIPLRYKELHGNNYLARGTLTKNLSEGGVNFKTDRFIPLACHLVVELKFPLTDKPIKAVSKIAWIKKLPVKQSFEMGNQFLAITDEDEKLLSEYLSARRAGA